jgi:hypothetical protein
MIPCCEIIRSQEISEPENDNQYNHLFREVKWWIPDVAKIMEMPMLALSISLCRDGMNR